MFYDLYCMKTLTFFLLIVSQSSVCTRLWLLWLSLVIVKIHPDRCHFISSVSCMTTFTRITSHSRCHLTSSAGVLVYISKDLFLDFIFSCWSLSRNYFAHPYEKKSPTSKPWSCYAFMWIWYKRNVKINKSVESLWKEHHWGINSLQKSARL